MAYQDSDFDRRVQRLTRTHHKLSRGHATYMRPDGLLVAAPAGRRRSRLSLQAIVLFVAAFFLFKVVLIVTVGGVTYDARVDRLAQGNLAEGIGAWAMQSDPLSERLAHEMKRLLP